MNYFLQILGNKDKAIEFELYENEKSIPIVNNKTQTLKLGNKTKEENNYILKIKYDKSKNTTTAELSENIEIKLHAEQ